MSDTTQTTFHSRDTAANNRMQKQHPIKGGNIMYLQKRRIFSLLIALVMAIGMLPAGLFTIPVSAAEITYDSNLANFTLTLSGDEKHPQSSDYLIIQDYSGTATAIQIPEEASYTYADAGENNSNVNTTKTLPIKVVDDLLPYQSTITHVKLGANVERIGHTAMGYTDTLLEVEIPEGSKLRVVDSSAFCNTPNLARVGVNGGYSLPDTVETIAPYAFRGAGITQLDLSACTKLEYIHDAAFSKCESLTTVTLPHDGALGALGLSAFNGSAITSIDVPATVTYLGMNSFSDCEDLHEVIFRGDLAEYGNQFWESSYSLAQIARDAVVRVDFSRCSKGYEAAVETIYARMAAHSDVRLTDIDSTAHQTVPSVKSSNAKSVITLSNADGENASFVYDWNDSDGDGFGGIITLNGVATEMALTINGSSVSNCDQFYWNYGMVYTDNVGMDEWFLRGKALADDAMRRQARGYVEESAPTVSLDRSGSDYGAYLYYPKLVNKGNASRPDSAVCGAPVLVIYRPISVDTKTFNVGIKAGTISLKSDRTDSECTLTDARAATVKNRSFLTPWVEDPTRALTREVTAANITYNGKPHKMTYQWYVSEDKNISNATAVSGASGIPVITGYGGGEALWSIPGISKSYLDSLDMGIYYFFVQVTVEMGGKTATASSDPCSVVVYEDLEISKMIFDAADIGDASYFTKNDSTANGTSMSRPIVMRPGTRNLFIYPELPTYDVSGLEDLTLSYEWSYANKSRNSRTMKTISNAPVVAGSDLPIDGRNYPEKVGEVYAVQCVVRLKLGDRVLDSDSKTFYIKTSGAEVTYDDWMTFADKQSDPYLGTHMEVNQMDVYTTENMTKKFGTTVNFTLYEGLTGDQVGGGTAVVDGNNDFGFTSGWQLSDGTWRNTLVSTAVEFDSYAPRWVYWKAELREDKQADYENYAPIYSEPFLFYPTYWTVSDKTLPKPTSKVKVDVLAQPLDEVWFTGNEVFSSVSVDLNLTNLPAIYESPNADNVLMWQYYVGPAEVNLDNPDSDANLKNPENWRNILNPNGGAELEYVKKTVTVNRSRLVGSTASTNVTATLSMSAMQGYENLGNSNYVPYESFFNMDFLGADEDYMPTTVAHNTRLVRLVVKDTIYGSGSRDKDWIIAASDIVKVHAGQETNEFADFPEKVVYDALRDTNYGDLYWGTYKSGSKTYYAYLPDDEVQYTTNRAQIFCDELDGLKAENPVASNMPDSPPAKFQWRSVAEKDAEPSAPTLMFYVESTQTGETYVLDSTAVADYRDTTEPITIGSAQVYLEGGLQHGQATDKYRTHIYVVVAPGEGAQYDVLRITPVQKINWNYGTDHQPRYITLDPAYVTVNPRDSVSEPSVSSSGSDQVKDSQQVVGVPLTVNGYINVLDHEEVTYQWYRSLDATYDIGTDLPVGEPGVSIGSVKPELTIDSAEIASLENMGAQQAYYYLWASNYDPNARKTQTWTKRSSSAYRLDLRPDMNAITPSGYQQGGLGTTEIVYGETLDEALGRITVDKPAEGVRQYVYFHQIYHDPASGRNVHNVSTAFRRDTDGTISYTGYYFDVTEAEDSVTAQYKIADHYSHFIGTEVGETTYYWSIEEDVWAAPSEIRNNYVGTARRVETETEEFTVVSSRPKYPTLDNLTLDTTNNYFTIIQDPILTAALGIENNTGLYGFKQYHTSSRPLSVDVTVPEGVRAQIVLEYLDMTTKPYTWKETYFSRKDDFLSHVNDTAVSGTVHLFIPNDSNSEGYYLNPGYTDVYYRFKTVGTKKLREDGVGDYDNEYGTSYPAYSDIFILHRMEEEDGITDAEYPSSNVSLPFYYWAKNDLSITEMTLGIKDNWYVEDGGTLSYEWEYLNSENNWVPLGTDDTLTLTRTQVEELYATRDGEDEEIRFHLTVTNTNLANTNGNYEASTSRNVYLYFRDMAVTPQVTLSGNGAELTVGSELSGSSVAATVSNPSSMGELTYEWHGRILGYTPVGSDTAYTIPEESLPNFSTFTDLYSSDPNRNVFTNANKVAVSLTDDFYMYRPETDSFRSVSLTGQDNYYSVWQYADSVTMELYCTVENTDTAQEENWQTSSVDTKPITVTFKVPDYLRPDALKVTAENDDFCINDDESIVLRAPVVSGRTFAYEWKSKETEDTDYYYTFTDSIEAALTLSSSNYNANHPWVGCEITDTDLNIVRDTDFKQVTRSVTGEAVKPTVIIEPNTIAVMPGAGTGQYFKANAWAPDGGTLSYLWARYRPETDEYVSIPGANTDTLYVDAYDDVPGEYIFMCIVSSNKDGQYASNDMTCYLDVIGVDFNLPDDLPTAAVGLPYSFSFEVNNYGGAYYMKDIVWTLPDGWTIAKENGEEDLTDNYPGQVWILSTNSAAAVTNGAVTITGTQDDETVTFTDTFTLQVEDVIIDGDGVLTPVPMNQTTNLPALTAKGSSGGYTWKLNSAPDWLTINPSTGVLTANKPAVPGRYDISVTVTSGAGKSATRTLSLPVAGPHAEKPLDIIDSTGKEFYIDAIEDVSSGSGWSYDLLTGVLYLDGFNGRQIWSSYEDELWIVLSGDSKLENTTSSEDHILLFKTGALRITTAEGVSAAKLDLSSSGLKDYSFCGIYALNDLTIDEGVTLNVNLENDNGDDCTGWHSYGDRTLKGDGAMNIRVSGSGDSGATLVGIGLHDLSVYDDMDLTVTVDAQNTAATALGFRDTLYTYGTGDVTITCKDSTYMMVPLGWNGAAHVIAHTGGTLTLQASYTGKKPDTCCAIFGGASYIDQLDESKYEIIGDPNGTFVSYRALTSSETPKLTPGTLEPMEVAANVAMEDLTVKAASSDSVTWTVTGLPAGLTFTPAADTYSGVLSGTPTENGVYTVKITASNSAGSTDLIFSLTVSSTVVWLEDDVEIKANGTLFYMPDIEYTGVPMDSWFIEVPASAPFTLVNNDYYVYAAEIKEGAVLTPSDTPWICTLNALDAENNVIATSEVPVYIRANAPNMLYLTDYIGMYGGNPLREDYESEDGCVKYDHLTGTLTLNNLSVEYTGYGALDFSGGHLNVVYSGTNTISAGYDAVEIEGTVCFRAKNDNASLNFKSENGRALYGYNTDAVDGAITFQGGKVLLESQNDDAAWLNPSDSYTPIKLVDVVNFTARTNATAEDKSVNLYNRVILDYSTEKYYVAGDAEGSKEYIVTLQSPAPVADMPSGTVFGTSEMNITITCADEEAEIYYLVDGALPIVSNISSATKINNGGVLNLNYSVIAGGDVTVQLVSCKDGVYSDVNRYTYYKIGSGELEAVVVDPEGCTFFDDETVKVTLSHNAVGVKITWSTNDWATSNVYNGTPIEISDTTTLAVRAATTYTEDGAKNYFKTTEHTYTKNPPVTMSGSMTADYKASVTVQYLPEDESATLLVAQYRAGQLVAVKTQPVSENGTFSIDGFSHKAGDVYKAFLLDGNMKLPLCAAKPLAFG